MQLTAKHNWLFINNVKINNITDLKIILVASLRKQFISLQVIN